VNAVLSRAERPEMSRSWRVTAKVATDMMVSSGLCHFKYSDIVTVSQIHAWREISTKTLGEYMCEGRLMVRL
jgi:hypothetical protein